MSDDDIRKLFLDLVLLRQGHRIKAERVELLCDASDRAIDILTKNVVAFGRELLAKAREPQFDPIELGM